MPAPGAPEWIALTQEAPVDPQRQIIDAHHHLAHALTPLGGTGAYLFEDLLKDARAGHHVTHTVYIENRERYRTDGPEPLRPVGEIEFAAAQAEAMTGSGVALAAIVGYADLTLGDAVQDVLAALAAAGHGRFRGVRFATPSDPQFRPSPRPHLLADNAFRAGLKQLGKSGYSYDALIYHTQMPQLAETAFAVDGTQFVLNHLGFPLNVGPYNDRSKVRPVWQAGMRQLAACPNVVVKIGGIGMDGIFGMGWSARERPPNSDDVVAWWGDDIRWCIDRFGPSRCMFESNYPVDRRGVGYTVLWNAYQKIAAAYADREQDELFSGTAARIYRIER